MEIDADIAVVGLGGMGSNAAWRLAARGQSVIGLERFHAGHALGSSHGSTRIFRVACLEHPQLVPLARRSRQLFEELERSSGMQIMHPSGAVMIGPESGDVVGGTLKAAAAHDLPVERWERDEIAERLPQHTGIAGDHIGVWDPEAGLAFPERAVIAAIDAARAVGAHIYTDTRVTDIELNGRGVRIRTATRDFTARQAVVTAGPWLGKLVPELPLEPVRTPMMWFSPRPPLTESFAIEDFPTFVRAVDDVHFWGHGSGNGFGIKIGPDQDPNFRVVDPDTIDRYIAAADWKRVSELIERTIPGLDPTPRRTTTCMVTHTPDGQFLIGRPRHDHRLIVAGGGSGHAFKHAAGIGELVAQIACDESTLIPTGFVDPNRFADASSPIAAPARSPR